MSAAVSLTTTFGLVTVLVPVAGYFLVLGVLNSRRHPQMLTGRQDFALLIVALSPLFVLPALGYLGLGPLSLLVCVIVVCVSAVLLAPRGRCWVIYNIPADQARAIIGRIAASQGLLVRPGGPCDRSSGLAGSVRLSSFPLLRNVTVRLDAAEEGTVAQFERALSQRLGSVRAGTSPMAAVLVLVATGMLALPLSLTVGRAAEIVRLIGELLD